VSCPAVIHIDSFMRQRERFFANQNLHKNLQRAKSHMFKDLGPLGLLKEMHHLPPRPARGRTTYKKGHHPLSGYHGFPGSPELFGRAVLRKRGLMRKIQELQRKFLSSGHADREWIFVINCPALFLQRQGEGGFYLTGSWYSFCSFDLRRNGNPRLTERSHRPFATGGVGRKVLPFMPRVMGKNSLT